METDHQSLNGHASSWLPRSQKVCGLTQNPLLTRSYPQRNWLTLLPSQRRLGKSQLIQTILRAAECFQRGQFSRVGGWPDRVFAEGSQRPISCADFISQLPGGLR